MITRFLAAFLSLMFASPAFAQVMTYDNGTSSGSIKVLAAANQVYGEAADGKTVEPKTISGAGSLAGGVSFAPQSIVITGQRFSALTTESGSFAAAPGILYLVTASATATLPTAVGCVGQEVGIKNTGAGTVTMASTSSQTINGGAAGSTTVATTASKYFISDGVNWQSE